MKKVLLGVVILLLITSITYCQEQPLQLTIRSDKEVYEAWETRRKGCKLAYNVKDEINIEYKLENISKNDVPINKYIVKDGNLTIKLVDEKGNNIQGSVQLHYNDYWTSIADVDMISLAPGESLTGRYKLSYTLSPYFQGTYKITAFLQVCTKSPENKPKLLSELTSNTITIEVVEKK